MQPFSNDGHVSLSFYPKNSQPFVYPDQVPSLKRQINRKCKQEKVADGSALE
jgi:hypothetical protein